jgi:predicted TIM-barrel fold metal-dependent hydrolase
MWREGMRDAAGAPNVVCKISGLGMCDNAWTVDSIRPWVLECVEAFGTDRSFFGSNWPVDSLYSSYGDVVDAYEQIVADFSQDEQEALFSKNAERVFRI